MVTKLNDGEQQEIEDEAKQSTGESQSLVTLLQSGSSSGWERALQFCQARSEVSGASCPISPLCAYAQVLLGSPPPISFSRLPPVLSSTMKEELEPSFTVPEFQTVESLSRVEDGPTPSEVLLQTSSDASREQKTDSVLQETSKIPPAESLSTADSIAPGQQAGSSEATLMTQEGSRTSDTESTDSSTTSTKPHGAATGQMVETDPADVVTASTEVDSGSRATTQAADSEAQQETKSTDAVVPEKSDPTTEILQPSIQLDTTSVVSPTLTRPTPVLEVPGASVSAGGRKAEIVNTVTPSLSPTPTSDTAHVGVGEHESAALPQVIEPTIQVSGGRRCV